MCVHDSLVCITQVIRAGSSLRDVNERSSRRDVQDLVVTKGNGDILEAARHLSTGAVPPTTHSALVNHRAGAQNPIATLRLVGRGRRKDVSDGADNEGGKVGGGVRRKAPPVWLTFHIRRQCLFQCCLCKLLLGQIHARDRRAQMREKEGKTQRTEARSRVIKKDWRHFESECQA